MALQCILAQDAEQQKSCRALSLSGGGSKGAYEVGVLHELARTLNGTDAQYDVLSGISVGSLNAALLSLFEKGDELNQTEYMKDYWLNMTTDKVWAYWDGFEAYQALFNKSSIFDTSPLMAELNKQFEIFDHKIKRKLLVGATDIDTGAELVFDFDDLNPNEYASAVLGSASVPVVFPFTRLRGKSLVDSLSTGWNNNMVSAIQKCMEMVDDPEQIELDVIVMYPDRIPLLAQNDTFNSVHHYMRKNLLKGYYTLMSDIASFMRAYPYIKYRYFIQASEAPEPGYDLLSFKKSETELMIKLGQKDAKTVIAQGPGKSFEQFQGIKSQPNNLASENEKTISKLTGFIQ